MGDNNCSGGDNHHHSHQWYAPNSAQPQEQGEPPLVFNESRPQRMIHKPLLADRIIFSTDRNPLSNTDNAQTSKEQQEIHLDERNYYHSDTNPSQNVQEQMHQQHQRPYNQMNDEQSSFPEQQLLSHNHPHPSLRYPIGASIDLGDEDLSSADGGDNVSTYSSLFDDYGKVLYQQPMKSMEIPSLSAPATPIQPIKNSTAIESHTRSPVGAIGIHNSRSAKASAPATTTAAMAKAKERSERKRVREKLRRDGVNRQLEELTKVLKRLELEEREEAERKARLAAGDNSDISSSLHSVRLPFIAPNNSADLISCAIVHLQHLHQLMKKQRQEVHRLEDALQNAKTAGETAAAKLKEVLFSFQVPRPDLGLSNPSFNVMAGHTINAGTGSNVANNNNPNATRNNGMGNANLVMTASDGQAINKASTPQQNKQEQEQPQQQQQQQQSQVMMMVPVMMNINGTTVLGHTTAAIPQTAMMHSVLTTMGSNTFPGSANFPFGSNSSTGVTAAFPPVAQIPHPVNSVSSTGSAPSSIASRQDQQQQQLNYAYQAALSQQQQQQPTQQQPQSQSRDQSVPQPPPQAPPPQAPTPSSETEVAPSNPSVRGSSPTILQQQQTILQLQQQYLLRQSQPKVPVPPSKPQQRQQPQHLLRSSSERQRQLQSDNTAPLASPTPAAASAAASLSVCTRTTGIPLSTPASLSGTLQSSAPVPTTDPGSTGGAFAVALAAALSSSRGSSNSNGNGSESNTVNANRKAQQSIHGRSQSQKQQQQHQQFQVAGHSVTPGTSVASTFLYNTSRRFVTDRFPSTEEATTDPSLEIHSGTSTSATTPSGPIPAAAAAAAATATATGAIAREEEPTDSNDATGNS